MTWQCGAKMIRQDNRHSAESACVLLLVLSDMPLLPLQLDMKSMVIIM